VQVLLREPAVIEGGMVPCQSNRIRRQAGPRWTACRVGTFRAMDAVRVPGVKRHPSRASLLTEVLRAGLDVAALAAAWPLLATARRGDGHPVLVLPGLMTGDPATLVLRTALRALGHHVTGWSLGLNRGPTSRVVHTSCGIIWLIRDAAAIVGRMSRPIRRGRGIDPYLPRGQTELWYENVGNRRTAIP
jgi:hypothetical protein